MTGTFHAAADRAFAEGRIDVAIEALAAGLAEAPDDHGGWMKLAALCRRSGDLGRALDAVNAALTAQPNECLALLLKGGLLVQLDEPGRAAEVYRGALFQSETLPTLPAPVAQELDRARQFLADHRRSIEASLEAQIGQDDAHRAKARRFLDNALDRRPVYHQEPTHYRYPGLADVEFFDNAYPELCDRLRQSWQGIRDEFAALFAQHADRQQPYVDFAPGQPVGQWSALNRSPKWNALHLLRYGEVDPTNAAACPLSMAAIAGPHQPDIANLAPNAMFSLLAPETTIPPHHGVANFRSVLHLPLIVPPGCRFRVGGETREWIAGEPWIFDDCIEHEAWNDSDSLRVILIVDLWRPELDSADRALIRAFMAAQSLAGEIGAL